jgi:UDP-glucose 4-epimerase
MSTDGTILVTGGAGYIGSHAVLALRAAGHSVVVLDDLSNGARSAIPADVPFVLGSAGDEALVMQIAVTRRIAAVLHFAGSIVVPESVTDPLGYYYNNTIASHALMSACARARIRHFIFSSTAAVYGMPDTLPIAEDAPLRPINPYGSSKLMTETILGDVAAAHDLRYVSLRYFNVAGADPLGRTGQSGRGATHLIKVACQHAIGVVPKMLIHGDDYPTPDGTCVRDYVHVADLADAHVAALSYLMRGGKSVALNCGYGRGYSVREVLQVVAALADKPLNLEIGPRRPGDPPALIAAADRIRRLLQWTPRYADLQVIVQSALAWERLRYRPHAELGAA